jgi:hypothetical protein
MPKGDNPNSRANLRPITKKTARELGRKGAAVSNAKQKAAKTFREELKALLEMEIANSKGEKVSTRKAISTALIKEAISGNYRAFAEIRDTIGEKPIEQQEVSIKEPRRFVFEIKK